MERVPATEAPTAGTVRTTGATAAAWYLWYKGLEYVPAGTVAVFFFAQPAVGAALGAALLGESLGTGFLGGGALMAVGIYAVSSERAGSTDAPPDPDESAESGKSAESGEFDDPGAGG